MRSYTNSDQNLESNSKRQFNLNAHRKWWKRATLCLLSMSLAITAATFAVSNLKRQLQLEDANLPTLKESSKGIQFFDRNNKYICTVRADRDRQPVPLDRVSVSMQQALVSAEDHHFYEHHGIDLIGVLRALKRNREAGRIVEGGSTITQQLVRNLYLDKNDRSYMRKIKEVFLSWDAENRFSKAKIMETYLNEIYFGGGVYGIERAANNYFNKHASKLNPSESAFLAGLIKSPSVYGNPANIKLAIGRQHEVLDKMCEYGYLSCQQAQSWKSQKLVFHKGQNPVKYPYYIAYALEQVKKELGAKMWAQDLKVYTNLDPAAQKLANDTLTRGIKNAPRGVDQGALVSLNVSDGAIVAMVGGVGTYQDSQWNRAIFPHTAGSCFKPFVYLAGLMNGILEPDSVIHDAPLAYKENNGPEWKPQNFDRQFKGWITVRDALINSRNICAIRVAMLTGLQPVIDAARAAGFRSKMDPFPSLALGTCAVSPLEMATAYATLARNGVYMPAQAIREIDCADGKRSVFHATPSSNLPGSTVATLVEAMQDVVNRGTGIQARLPGIPVAGKTGTADGARDIWFAGFTPDTVTTVWGGSDKNQAIKGGNVTGGTVMARIWREYMSGYYTIHKPTDSLAFAKPAAKFAGSIPELNDETLLTTDATSVDVTALDKIPRVDPLTVNPAQIANNVPTILANAISAKEKGVGKAFIVLAAEAAERFQKGTSAAARQYIAMQRPQQTSLIAQAEPVYVDSMQPESVQSYSTQPTPEQFAYTRKMLSLQASQAAQIQ
ncbi:MAG: PBP1A family penicillin-binding protein [Candidatus Obscuribacterales bacterium]